MPRGCRRYVLAAFGWLILAASPPSQPAQGDKAASQQVNSAELARIAAALEKLAKAPPLDAGCDAGQDDRSSDLCAQWKAADAALSSAVWTKNTFFASVVGLVIGGFTLVAAGFAAWYARNAWLETRRGNIVNMRANARATRQALASGAETRRAFEISERNAEAVSSQAESAKAAVELTNRPVLVFDGIIPDPPFSEQTIPVRFAFRNIGKTPALSVSFAYARDKGNAVGLPDRIAKLGMRMGEQPIEETVAPDSFESFGKTGCHVGLLVESSFYREQGGAISETFDRVLVVVRIKYRSAFQALDSEYSTEVAISIQPEWSNGKQTGRLQANVVRGTYKIR